MRRLRIVTACAVFCLASLVFGCKTYYENAGLRLRAGNVKAPLEISEPTSSTNAKFMFMMDGTDVYVAKGYCVEVEYSAVSSGTWLTSAMTQSVYVVVSPTNGTSKASK